ncbi:MAG: metallophosphoesterase family protein [Treponema sp.]|nr:metallophosphoesterase family protein [Treponema sp.]
MRLLILSDLHGAVEALAELDQSMRSADLILIAGDLTDFGGSKELRALLDVLGPFRSKMAAVPGNCDRRGARELLEQEGLSADGRLLDTGGALVAGSGGGILHTGLTPYERRDEELGASLETALANRPGGASKGRPLIVLSHTPPRDSGADNRHGSALGSRRYKDILEKERPPLWACGHIHESRSSARRGATLVVNPGAFKEGFFATVELRESSGELWHADAELGRI